MAGERDEALFKPPSTRYQGSKLKLLPWLRSNIESLEFATALDAFGGSGSVSYLMKSMGKVVTYNDLLPFNHQVGLALIENSRPRLQAQPLGAIAKRRSGRKYGDVVERVYADIYFVDEENRWLDVVAQNIAAIPGAYERAVAYYALFQACMVKRPYNLFHRKNLYMRTSDVPRSFGNKKTWDTSFDEHYERFVAEINQSILPEPTACRAWGLDVQDLEGAFDLVYVDPPYVNGKGIGVDYADFYHFLNGMIDYDGWEAKIDLRRKHRPLHRGAQGGASRRREKSPWTDPRRIHDAFLHLFERFRDSTLVVSYRSDGIPSVDELVQMLRRVKKQVSVSWYGEYQYALSKNSKSREVLLVAI